MIQAIVFDFGNVLCRVDRTLCNQAMAAHSRLGADEVGRRVWGGDIERDAETGRISAQEHFHRIKEAIGGEEGWEYNHFIAEYRSAIQPYPAGEAALVGAHRLGLRCFILSNTSFVHSHCIFSSETCCTVPELHALSFKLGWMKPDPRCWTWLLERAGLTAEECIYVDDVPEYCAAAAGLGFRTIQHEIGANDLLQDIQGMLYSG